MSTAKIREALKMLDDALTHPNATDAHRAVVASARAELEAIEKAALDYVNEETHDPKAMWRLMERIAAQRKGTS